MYGASPHRSSGSTPRSSPPARARWHRTARPPGCGVCRGPRTSAVDLILPKRTHRRAGGRRDRAPAAGPARPQPVAQGRDPHHEHPAHAVRPRRSRRRSGARSGRARRDDGHGVAGRSRRRRSSATAHRRPGVPALREALGDWVLDGKPVDSVLEPAMRRLLDAPPPPAGRVPPAARRRRGRLPHRRQPVDPGVRRLGDPRPRPSPVRAGPHRDADLAALGFVVLRFTYRSIVRRPTR